MKNRIEVTEEHIKMGIRGASGLCAIGLALLDAFPDTDYGVCNMHIRIGSCANGRVYETNGYIEDFVNNFDAGRKVKPFTLVLDSDKLIAYND